MTGSIIRAPKFDFVAAVTQIFNLPSGKGYLFRVIGFGSLFLMAAFLLLGVPIIKGYMSMFDGIMNVDLIGMSEAEEMAAVMSSIQPLMASMGIFTLLYILQYMIYISVETALYRNIIRGEDKGFFPLRFAMDEFKVLVTRIVVAFIIYAVFFAVYFGVAIIGMILLGLGSAAGSEILFGLIGVVGVLLFFALVGLVIYASIRLAPSAAFAVRDEDFTPVGSWGTMQSYFWPTFGAILVAGLIGYIGLSIFFFLALGILLSEYCSRSVVFCRF